MNEKMYAVYSEKQRRLGGLTEWVTPDGRTIIASSVGPSKNAGGTWDDTVELGEVVKFLRRIEVPSI